MWSPVVEHLTDDTLRVRVRSDGRILTFVQVVRRWDGEAAFRTFFSRTLAEAPHRAFLWETPPVTRATIDKPFEFVLVDSPALAAMPTEPHPFSAPLGSAQSSVATFWNLGRDALLVVPRAEGPEDAYAQLAAFVRGAPDAQQHAFWRAVAAAWNERLGTQPLWLSTSGLGVAWLHVRLDDRPKYYHHASYRRARGTEATGG